MRAASHLFDPFSYLTGETSESPGGYLFPSHFFAVCMHRSHLPFPSSPLFKKFDCFIGCSALAGANVRVYLSRACYKKPCLIGDHHLPFHIFLGCKERHSGSWPTGQAGTGQSRRTETFADLCLRLEGYGQHIVWGRSGSMDRSFVRSFGQQKGV